jgi:murein DD-endopeptidase MepM/ murein hydrolase activator NlpD
MPDVRFLYRTTLGRRFVAAIGIVLAGFAARHAWQAERQSSALRDEVKWLRTRLGDKREVIARQRQEMSRVAGAVDHLARTTSALGERAAQARRLAHMEQSRVETPGILSIAATLDGGMSIESEDAGHALEELAWLEGQATAASDSLVVLAALVKQRESEALHSVPTLWPVHGLVTSPFGARTSPYGEGREMHPGIDISARYGLPVTAPGNGQVIFAGRDAGYGGLVIIDHGGELDTLYGHLSALYVREGEPVHRGQALGAVGATGRATGAHLHYEVRVNGTPVDPRRYLVN